MPSVASEVKTPALKPHSPQPPRPPAASDHVSPSPFESLLDDGTQSVPPSPPPPPDHTAKTEGPDPTHSKAAGKGEKSATQADHTKTADNDKPGEAENGATPEQTAKSDKANKSSKANKIGKIGKTADDLKATGTKVDGDGKTKTGDKKTDAKTDTKTDAQAATGALTLPNADKPAVAATANPAPAPAPTDPASAPAKDDATAPTSAPATAVATATLAPTGDAVKQTATAAHQADAVTADAPKDKPAAALPAQADADKPADDTNAPAKGTQSAQGDGKPQAATTDSDKQAIAHARGQAPASGHRAAAPNSQQPAVKGDTAAAAKPGSDVTQTLVINAPVHSAAAPNASAAPAAAPASQMAALAPVPLAGVAVAIAGKALEGKNRFEIRLDPPELGRIEVRLDVDRDGQVTSHLIAHRADTLDLLRRDAAGLQRALQDAGLKTADNGLQFSLHDQSSGHQQDTAGSQTAHLVVQDEALGPVEPTPNGYSQLASLRGGLDIRI